MPKFLLEQFIRLVIPNLEKENSFRVKDLEISQYMHNVSVPIIYIASVKDSIIPYSHIQQLYSITKGQKVLKLIPQDHGEPRDYFDYQHVIQTHLHDSLALMQRNPVSATVPSHSHRYSI